MFVHVQALKTKSPLFHAWGHLFVLGILSSYFYVAMEWLFFVTKPSFMDAMDGAQKIGVLFTAGAILMMFSLLPVFILFGLDLVFRVFLSESSTYVLYAAAVFPAITLTALALILIDNFTYTVFELGIVSTQGIVRIAYIPVLLLLFHYFYQWGLHFIGFGKGTGGGLKFLYLLSTVLILVSAVLVFQRSNPLSSQSATPLLREAGTYPNILILGSDGVNATNMSIYGYDRETTPYLQKLMSTSLVAENVFPNAGNSTGSVTSLLTGKLPTETRVLYTPNILSGSDAFQHLPGILRNLGYFNAEMGYTKYIDAYEVNMQDAFHLVNQRSLEDNPFFRIGRRYGYGDSFFFFTQMFERISERILHILYIQAMENPYDLVKETEHSFYVDDHEKVTQLLKLIASTNEPLFVHVHLMGTHGPKFYPTRQVFSSGQDQGAYWMRDYYDDAILDFDGHVRRIFRRLEASGKLENTIIVLYTDHNMKYYTTQRVPLIFRFPNGEHAGRIQNNVQNIDIAPTLLDFLGVPVPDWMTGQSLLHGEPPTDRLIVSAVAKVSNPKADQPPFYQFATISAVVCDKWYEFRTPTDLFLTGSITGHTSPCKEDTQFGADAARARLLDHLQMMNFDVQTLPENDIYLLPYAAVTRAQVSMYLLKALYGTSYLPPSATGMFTDMSDSDPYAAWAEEIVKKGFDDGCSLSPRKFCPDGIVTRAQAAKLVLMAKEGIEYLPPRPEGVFADVQVSSQFAPWIEEVYRRDIARECGLDPLGYCPDEYIDFEHLYNFLQNAFNAS
jgi:arylsulfatase A-like enzyme